MKNVINIILITLGLFFVTSCGNPDQKKVKEPIPVAENSIPDANTVYVYYFHGKQRCMTCTTVEKVARDAVKANFANKNVRFLLLPKDAEANAELVDKYEIAWNGLIIAKGDNSVNITEQAFANAVNNPEVLVELINSEVNSRLN